jgi:ABC-type branched-subunit amino acid transport system substrate-binding protein
MGALYTSQTVNWGSNDPVTKRFVDSFKAKYGKDPTVYNANYYNASRLFALLASALQKKGKPITGESLLAERLETKTFEFVGGTVSFEQNGTVVATIQISDVYAHGGRMV